MALGCVSRARWRPGTAWWLGIFTAAIWWWVALEYSAARASGHEPSFAFMVSALVVSIPYVVFFRPPGRLQSVDEQRGLIAEIIDERLAVQSRMILHGEGEREELLIERLDQVMEDITGLRREIRAVGSD